MRDLSALLPATVRVAFSPRACGSATPDGLPDEWHEDARLADAAIAGSGAGTPAVLGVEDTCAAVWSQDGDAHPKNQDHLRDLAKVLAGDLWRWRTVAYDREYAGIITPDLEGLTDAAEWSYREGDCSTRLATAADPAVPALFNHADPGSDCEDCVGVYGPAMSKSGGNIVLKKYKLCREGGEIVRKDDGQDTLAACCQGTCTVYAVEVKDTKGDGVPGIRVTLQRYLGSPTTLPRTLSPIEGTTDSAGLFSYTLPSSPPQFVVGGTATIPLCTPGVRGGPLPGRSCDVANPTPTVVGSTCTYRFRLCKKVAQVTVKDGDTGAGISGASLGGGTFPGGGFGSLSGNDCAPVPDSPYYVVAGPTHTLTRYELSPVLPDGRLSGTTSAGYDGSKATSCKGGYWGDCAGTPLVCDETVSYDVLLWEKGKFLFNPEGFCHGNRHSVIRKSLCVTFLDAPMEVVGGTVSTLHWDPSTWDGNPDATNKVMVFRGCVPAGGAVGSCWCGDPHTAAVDVPYGSVEIVATFVGQPHGGAPQLAVTVTPHWDDSCGGAAPPCGCLAGGFPAVAGPHLACPVPHVVIRDDGTRVEDGQDYAAIMPTALGTTWAGAVAPVWTDVATGQSRFSPGQGDGQGLYSQEAALHAPNVVDPFSWGCSVYDRHFARVRVGDGGCDDAPAAMPTRPAMAAPPAPPRRDVVVRGHGNSYTGYGQFTAHLAKQLEAHGARVAYDAVDRDESFLPLDPWVAARLRTAGQPRRPALVAMTPNGVRDFGGDVVFTMWESSRILPEWADQLNRARCVVVPCAWVARSFRDSGVAAPIRIVPLGIDPAVYRPGGDKPAGPVVFGCAGRTAHGGVRKGIDDVIAAFLEAFPDEPDVRLEVKVWPDCRVLATDDPRVRVIRDPMTDAELAGWYRGLSAFVSASRSEGWGLQGHQAAACGRPTIAPIHGGHAEYMTPETTWGVEYDELPVPDDTPIYGGLGSWAVPRRESLVARMREAYADPEARRRKGEAAARRAAEFTWQRAGRELVGVLREFGLLPGGSATPAAAIPPADERPGIRELYALIQQAKACPFRTAPSCGCPGNPGTCSLGKGRNELVSLQFCLDCTRETNAAASVGATPARW